MLDELDSWRCSSKCWLGGAVIGLVLFLLLWVATGLGFAGSLLAGIVVAVVIGFFASANLCQDNADAGFTAPPAEPEPEVRTEPETVMKPEPEAAAPAPAPAPAAAPEPAPAPVQASTAPDDLKQIKGVGPKLEEKLNALGITRYDQIAAWTEQDVQRVDDQLNFRGRITRDDWIGQAKALASGS